MPTLRTLLAAALLLPAFAACDSSDDGLTITSTVVADADLSALESAILTTGLDDDLDGTGPFTVFAPTNAAFAALLVALDVTVEELLDRPDLRSILQLHVVRGEFEADDLSAGQSLTTLNGTIRIVASGSGLGIDTDLDGEADATLTTTNIKASNGVVHKINAVLLPTAN